MSILNVLLSADHLAVTVDTLAQDAQTGAHSEGAKLLLLPQHNAVLATRGSAQFFLRIYELCLQASFRADFTIERLSGELCGVIDRLWPNYVSAAAAAGIPISAMHTELVLGGWSAHAQRMVATAYAKSEDGRPAVVQALVGGLASPGEPLRNQPAGMGRAELMAAGRLQAAYLNGDSERPLAGGRLLAAILSKGQATVLDLGGL